MPKAENQKLKLLYLRDMLLEKTDEDHFLRMETILQLFEKAGISAERKSVYNDINMLRQYGMDIDSNRRHGYKVLNREFETAEVKALIDAVQYSRFISQRKTRTLIGKLKKLVSENEAKTLKINKALYEKIKSDNEAVLYAIDSIMDAISNNKQISCKYFHWDCNKEKAYSNGGKARILNPWDLCWDNNAYYLMASDGDNPTQSKTFRVDKMENVKVLEKKDRSPEGVEKFKTFNPLEFSDKHFSMYDGKVERVELRCTNFMANVIIDRFGADVPIIKIDDGHFKTIVSVGVSQQFYGWIFGLGKSVQIVAPQSVAEEYKQIALEIAQQQ